VFPFTKPRQLRKMGFARLSARPRHYAQDKPAIASFQKEFRDRVAELCATLEEGTEVEIGWQDEAARKTSGWARRGTRPSAPHGRPRLISSARSVPKKRRQSGLFCPTPIGKPCNCMGTRSVWLSPRAFMASSCSIKRAGDNLIVPANLTLLPLLPQSPELNSMENVWQYLRDNGLSNLVFETYEDIVEACCKAWTASPISLTGSNRSGSGIGRMGFNQHRLVLAREP